MPHHKVLAPWCCWNASPERHLVLQPHSVLWTSLEVRGGLCPWTHRKLFPTPPGQFLINLTLKDHKRDFLMHSKMKKNDSITPKCLWSGVLNPDSPQGKTSASMLIWLSSITALTAHAGVTGASSKWPSLLGCRQGRTCCSLTRRKVLRTPLEKDRQSGPMLFLLA